MRKDLVNFIYFYIILVLFVEIKSNLKNLNNKVFQTDLEARQKRDPKVEVHLFWCFAPYSCAIIIYNSN